ncbi:YqaJ viral recombinase family protein [Candidatus Thiothrix sp. Deng01]|uniref:YqaJ viral recombinase family protein n=1 Tax=Candidatus Thiothrix phosphatis TaxID=3112415 RepID=A0ABU6CUF2_9GAMM|nr:YqaJ viral recombinase family protein [Candidatus Thiothrix sp. Deng01]MEB4590003.1 YqaJ viral recombinase family protein [Candidatus Thiothrix sp. Deng01]
MLHSLTSLSDSASVGAGLPPSLATLSDLTNVFAMQPVSVAESPEIKWKKQRWGKFSASMFGKLFVSGRGKGEVFGKTAHDYIEKIAAQRITNFNLEDEFTTAYIEAGKEREAEAIQRFADKTGLELYMTGNSQEFIVSACGNYGCTPDGLIGMDAGIEAKAPKYSTHVRYLSRIKTADDLLLECPDYYWQCIGGMELTGRDVWHWFSFHPEMMDEEHKLHIVEIRRDEKEIKRLRDRLSMAIECRDIFLRGIE